MENSNEVIKLVEDVISCYDRDAITATERKIAEKMIQMVMTQLGDNIKVRLAHKLQYTGHLSPEIARQLINDSNYDICLPVLENSPVLHDADIVQLLKDNDVRHMNAVSKRYELSSEIVSILVNFAIENSEPSIVTNVTWNENANIDAKNFQIIVDNFIYISPIQSNLCFRVDLPKNIALHLLKVAADHLKVALAVNYDLPSSALSPQQIDNMLAEAVEKEQAIIAEGGSPKAKSAPAIPSSAKEQILQDILRPLCIGNKQKFIRNFSNLIEVPEFVVVQALQNPNAMSILLGKLKLDQQYKNTIKKLVYLFACYEKEGKKDEFAGYVLLSKITLPESEKNYLLNYYKG